MNYIRYHETETLFKHFPEINRVMESLQVDLKNLRDTKESHEEYIYSEMMATHDEHISLPSGYVSDKTGNLATKKGSYYYDSSKGEREVRDDILALDAIIKKISIGMNSLSKVQKLILETYYWEEEMTWKRLCEILKQHQYPISRNQAMAERVRGIKKIMNISKIGLDQYRWVKGFLDI